MNKRYKSISGANDSRAVIWDDCGLPEKKNSIRYVPMNTFLTNTRRLGQKPPNQWNGKDFKLANNNNNNNDGEGKAPKMEPANRFNQCNCKLKIGNWKLYFHRKDSDLNLNLNSNLNLMMNGDQSNNQSSDRKLPRSTFISITAIYNLGQQQAVSNITGSLILCCIFKQPLQPLYDCHRH